MERKGIVNYGAPEGLGQMARRLRKNADVSQKVVGELVGLSQAEVSHIETGKYGSLDNSLAMDLATLLADSAGEAIPLLLLASGFPPQVVNNYMLSFTNEILASYEGKAPIDKHTEEASSMTEVEIDTFESSNAIEVVSFTSENQVEPEELTPLDKRQVKLLGFMRNVDKNRRYSPDLVKAPTEEAPLRIERKVVKHYYEEVAEEILERIKSGKYVDMLPSEHELCEDFDLSRGTIRQGMRLLREQGVVEPVQGVGTIILKKAVK